MAGHGDVKQSGTSPSAAAAAGPCSWKDANKSTRRWSSSQRATHLPLLAQSHQRDIASARSCTHRRRRPTAALICFFAFLAVASVLFGDGAEACSCFVSHPQDHYCSADFVAVINVRRQGNSQRNMDSYFVKVKKEFKMTAKAEKALSAGLIYTSTDETSCGRKFEHNTRYLITGRVVGDKAWVSICNFVQEWATLTAKQRKGFRRLYASGCRCKVREQPSSRSIYSYKARLGLTDARTERPGYCHWETKWDSEGSDCQGLYSICAPVATTSTSPAWIPGHGIKGGSGGGGNRSASYHHGLDKAKKHHETSKNRQQSKKKLLLHHQQQQQQQKQSLLGADFEEKSSGAPECQWLQSHEFRACMKRRKLDSENETNLEREWEP